MCRSEWGARRKVSWGVYSADTFLYFVFSVASRRSQLSQCRACNWLQLSVVRNELACIPHSNFACAASFSHPVLCCYVLLVPLHPHCPGLVKPPLLSLTFLQVISRPPHRPTWITTSTRELRGMEISIMHSSCNIRQVRRRRRDRRGEGRTSCTEQRRRFRSCDASQRSVCFRLMCVLVMW